MKLLAAFFLLLISCGVALGDSPSPAAAPKAPAPLLRELVAMTRAGSSDVDVLAYARTHRTQLPPELSDAQVAYLRDSGVSSRVVTYMAAIDVRPSDSNAPGSVRASSVAPTVREDVSYPSDVEEAPSDIVADTGSGDYAQDGSPGFCDDCVEDYGCTPFVDCSSFYPYPPYVFALSPGFFSGFRFRGHRGFFRGGETWRQRGPVAARLASRDAWRGRNFAVRRPAAAATRGALARRAVRSAFAARPRGFSGRPKISGHGGFSGAHPFASRPHFSGGGHPGGFRSAPGGSRGFSAGRARR